jgi:hypothetical protein
MTQPLDPRQPRQNDPSVGQWIQGHGSGNTGPHPSQGQWNPDGSFGNQQPPTPGWGPPQGPQDQPSGWGPPPQGPQNQPSGWGPPPSPKAKKKWPWVAAAVVGVIIVVSVASKGGSGPTSDAVAAPTASATAESAAPSAAASTPSENAPTTAAASPAPAQAWTMPRLVGVGLQDAQDRIQALTGDEIFYTSSHDVTGAGRLQVIDANWTVCAQNIRAGSRIVKETQIDFGVVKLGESCA